MRLSPPASTIYTCRLCGKNMEGVHVPDGMRAMMIVEGFEKVPPEWGGHHPGVTDHHRCADGRTGLADFAGVEFDGTESDPCP